MAKKIKEILLFANEIPSGILISIDRDVKELSLIAVQYGLVLQWYEILSTTTMLANLLYVFYREWYRGFKHDCPNGQLSKQTIIDICNQILPGGNSTTFVDQIFRIFDKDNNGTIDFKEFMLATDMTSAGTAEEKLAWAFKV